MAHLNDRAPRPFPPLPDSFDMDRMSRPRVEAEITLMLAEVRNAISRHRRAWKHMAQVKRDLLDDGREFIDEERPYKLAVGDVKWWREELVATSAALSALVAYAERTPRPTTPAERQRPPAERPQVTIFGWDPDGGKPPSESQYQIAKQYQDALRNSNQLAPAGHWDMAQMLIDAYEAAPQPGAVRPTAGG